MASKIAISQVPPSSPLRCSPDLQSLLKRLHEQSSHQEAGINPNWNAIRQQLGSNPSGAHRAIDELMVDKFIALDEDKCHFMYNLILANNATTVVEAGTSFGVSTIYLALAVDRNTARAGSRKGLVIGTEKEKSKAEVARSYWEKAGPRIKELIHLRIGDLNETLTGSMGLAEGQLVDFLLLDIWAHVALAALNLILPKLRPGAVVLTDNVISSADGYKELLKILRDPVGPFRSTTLPFNGGLEMSIYDP